MKDKNKLTPDPKNGEKNLFSNSVLKKKKKKKRIERIITRQNLLVNFKVVMRTV